MPLDKDVNLEKLRRYIPWICRADLQALAEEAAMRALRKVFPEIDLII